MLILDDVSRSKLSQIYDLYKDDLYRKAYYILKDHQLAQDVMQSAIIKISNHLHRIDEIDSVRTKAYVLTIVKNLAIDVTRKKAYQDQKKISSHDNASYINLKDEEMLVEDWMIDKEKTFELNKCISKLKKSHAEIIYLRYFEELTINEISEILGIKSNHVSVKINRAITALRQEVSNNEYFGRKSHVG